MDASAPPIAAVPPDDPVASYLEKYGQDPVSSYLEKYGPKPTAPVLKPLRVPMASADATSIYQPRRPSEPATIPERTPLIQSPRDVTATVASPQSAPIAPPDAQALRADLFRQSPLGEVDAQVPNLIAGAAQFPADVITHPIASAYRAVTAPVRAVKAAFQTGEAVSKSVHDTGAPAPPFQESAENLIGSSMDVAALTMPVIRGAGALADASTADAVEGARSAVTAPSTPSLAPEGPKDMHAGIPPLPKGALNDLSTAAKEALTDVYAPIRDRAPELHEALHSAGAMPPVSAGRFVGGLVDRSLRDLTPEQQDVFGKRILLDNLEAEAERKTTAAADAATQAQAEQAKAEQPSKSARDLWYSRTTPGGALRAPAEMETDPLIDELARRAEASKVYHADARRFGPTSAVTMRNEAQIGNIEGILQERDGLHPDDIWREVARRNEVAHANGEDFDFGASAGEHGEPLDIDQHLPTAPVTETGARARMLSEAAQNFTARADALRTQLPANVESEPWFQQALDRAKMNVQGFNEAGAVGAGVDPSTFRRPSLGLYMRLLSQDRVNEQNIRNAQATAERNPGATEPRTGVAKLILGQKPDVVRLTPKGADAPVQGPEYTGREKPPIRNLPPGTAASASKLMATGSAREYVSDFRQAAVADARDKVAKMQKNAVYDAIAKIPNAELGPEENAPAGKRVIIFNDLHQLVDPPPEGKDIPVGFRRFAVPTEVANAVDQFQQQVRGQTGPPKVLKKIAGAATRSVLLNPLVAYGHGRTLASTVGTGIPADAGAAEAIAKGVPLAKVASTLARFKAVDFDDPGTVARLHRLALEGALRISPDDGGGWLNKGHHILFGPSGIDPRARLVASEDFEAGAKKAGLTPKDPAFAGLERDYVTGHAGNYVGRNSGSAAQFLQDAGITPFIAINKAKYGTAFKSLAGSSGAPLPEGGAQVVPRLLTAARGPAGFAAATAGIGYLLSGHPNTQNAPGHEDDIASGVYHLPDANGVFHPTDPSSYRYFRGNPDEAAKVLGPHAKEVYLRKGFMDPSSAAALRILEPIAYAKKGDKVSGTIKAAANAALGMVGPAPAAAWALGTGHDLYLDRDGALGSIQGVHLNADDGIPERIMAVARNLNAGAAMGIPEQTPGARSGLASLIGNLNPFTEATPGTAPRDAADKRDESTWQQDVVKRIYGERDPVKRQAVADQAMHEAQQRGFTGPKLEGIFTKAVNKAGVDRSDAAREKFLNEIKGSANAPAADDPVESYLKTYGGKRP